jgi:hypothetical protein
VRALAIGLITFLLLTAAGRAADPAPPVDYAAASSWLCRPGVADACAIEISATTLRADGTTARKNFTADAHAPIDCFYVYPTISRELKRNSDLAVDREVRNVVKQQFVRFGTVCRLFAPLYRQVTDAGLLMGGDRELAYGDVLAAWNYYLAHDNGGRGVVLIGHSQGATVLTRLIAEQIDGKPVQKQLVAALLPGTRVDVVIGKDIGGTFAHIPLCRARAQTQCAIAYSSYLASAPPGEVSPFGKSPAAGMMDACVDPAALDGSQTLNADLPAIGPNAQLGTTYLNVAGVIMARCVWDGERSYLAVTTGVDARGERVDGILTDINGILPGWGLHLIDVNLTLENLVDIVSAQARAWDAKPAR